MARGFGSSIGVGTADLITTSLTTNAYPTRAWHVWVNRNGNGGGGNGRIFDQRLGTAGGNWLFANTTPTATTLTLNQSFSIADASFSWTAPANGSWISIGIVYDNSNTTNLPSVYQNGVALSIGAGGGNGVVQTGAGKPFCIGNRSSDSLRNWDGQIGSVTIWDDAIVREAEFKMMAAGYSPLLFRRNNIVCHWDLGGYGGTEPGLTGNGLHGIVTGTKPTGGPPLMRQFEMLGYMPFQAIVPTFMASWAQQTSNLPILGTGTN